MKKLRSKSGETLIESIASVLVILLIFVFLTTAITTANKINKKAKDADVSFKYEDSTSVPGASAEIAMSGSRKTVSVSMRENNGYYYYTMS